MREALSIAARTLLGLGAAGATVAETVEPWSVNSGTMAFTEFDRVTWLVTAINARKQVDAANALALDLTFDVLVGASPNGANAAGDVQVFTSASGQDEFAVAPGETPLDDDFADNRIGVNLGWERALTEFTTLGVGANASSEFDYTSLGGELSVARDFDQRNTTVLTGLSYAFDMVHPVGGVPTPLASMQPANTLQPRQGASEDKTVADLLLGVTRVVDRRTVAQFNYGYSLADGYLTDPYKLVSVVSAAPGAALGTPVDYVYEFRPGDRAKQSLYGAIKRQLSRGVLDFSYRYLWDDWGITSHTLDLRYRRALEDNRYIQPHLRYYHQSAADFYDHSLVSGDSLPALVSADYRLGEFDAVTLGLKYGRALSRGRELGIRVEYYAQFGDSHPADAIGEQRSQDLFPTVDAITATLTYSFDL